MKEYAGSIWEDGYNHPFVQELGRGELAKEKYRFYLLQDYHYLLSYAKVFALGAIKSDTEEMISRFTRAQYGTLHIEMKLHKEYMASFGITDEEVMSTKASLFNKTYTAYMLSEGQSGGLAEIIAAVFPCAWTYYDYGCRLKRDYADVLADNFYRPWIETYSGAEFKESFEWFYEALDALCERKSDAERRKIADIFVSSVEFEYLFWEMSYKQMMSYV